MEDRTKRYHVLNYFNEVTMKNILMIIAVVALIVIGVMYNRSNQQAAEMANKAAEMQQSANEMAQAAIDASGKIAQDAMNSANSAMNDAADSMAAAANDLREETSQNEPAEQNQ